MAEAWRSVVRLQGTAAVTHESAINEPNFGDRRVDRYVETADIRFELEIDRESGSDRKPQLIWRAKKAIVNGMENTGGTGTMMGPSSWSRQASYSGTAERLKDFTFTLYVASGEWQLLTPGRTNEKHFVTTKVESTIPGVSGTDKVESSIIPSILFKGKVPPGMPAAIDHEVLVDTSMSSVPSRPSFKKGRLFLTPEFIDVEVVLEIEDYAKWRPLGSISSPKKPGNSLRAKATLKPKEGGAETLPKVKQVKYRLLDTSREPGVCLNWPLEAKDKDPDLRLVATPGLQGVASNEDQELVFASTLLDDKNQPYAPVQIDSFDFGGRGTLLVTFELSDGRSIAGVLKQDGANETMVRLPKMKGPDWIAESWRKENNVPELPAGDDDESVEGQPMNGDGYTLYEEYRGWVEAGKHIEGDAKQKDFFILNDVGVDAVGGFRLFSREARIRVHHRLTEREMSQEMRLMNGNHRDAPHRVDQHGVYIRCAWGTGIPDAGTTGMTNNDTRRAFRPGRVREITIEPKSNSNSTFSVKHSVDRARLNEREAVFAYDRAVAHELLHSVGVDHHGEGEEAAAFFFQAAGDPNNKTRRVGFTRTLPHVSGFDLRKGEGYVYRGNELDRQPTEYLIWEDTGRSIAEEMAPAFERKLAERRAERAKNPPKPEYDNGRFSTEFPVYGKSPSYWRESQLYDETGYFNDEFEVVVTIGELQKADSGNATCLMRYYFATAYPVPGQKGTFYVIRPGTNRAGRMICRDPAGTEFNAKNHPPQPRFGDAAPGRGGCFAQICPNDAIPPRSL